jgi:hypothetical protein
MSFGVAVVSRRAAKNSFRADALGDLFGKVLLGAVTAERFDGDSQLPLEERDGGVESGADGGLELERETESVAGGVLD